MDVTTHFESKFGRSVILETIGRSQGHLAGVFERFGTVPEVDESGGRVDKDERASASQGTSPPADFQQVSFLHFLASNAVEAPFRRIAAGGFATLAAMHGHPSWTTQREKNAK